VERGGLRAESGRYAREERRGDPRFPGVADMIAYQAAFAAETTAALRATAP
jgi:hypothetical protein